jgi:TatD DNase family protein
MEFFDSHAHYNDERFKDDYSALLEKIYNEGITHITCVGYNLESSKKAIEIANQFDFVYSTCGISPNDMDDKECLDKIEELILSKKVVAVGEIGLDYYWNKENKFEQQELFIKQIDLANKYDLPIVIHTREATVDTIKILKEHPCNKKGIFHCCPLNQELIKEGLKLGFYISFSGNITFKSAKSDDCINLVPDNKILIETDSPYLTPEPFRGTRNDSSKVKLVAEKIAMVKGISVEKVAEESFKNACTIFNI